jgi:hypothetical protein
MYFTPIFDGLSTVFITSGVERSPFGVWDALSS